MAIARASAEWVGAAFVDFLEVSSLPADEVRERIDIVVEKGVTDCR